MILPDSSTTRGSLCMTLAHLLTRQDQRRTFCADPDERKRALPGRNSGIVVVYAISCSRRHHAFVETVNVE